MPFVSSVLEKQHGENVEIMRNTDLIEHASVETDEMRDEYQFDYSRAKPNRFADKIGQDQLMVVLDPDVAAVFKTPAAEVQTVEHVWPMLSPVVFVPHVESEYQRLVAVLDTLIDVVGENENHPLASLMEVIGVLIEKYEDEHVPELTEI